ncbi:MAG: 5-formyltetrahydrofolate cyclo-ligase [Halioglobus sp.]
MAGISPTKVQLRRILRQRRQAISASAQQFAAHSLTQSVRKLPIWDSAERVAVYMAADGEIDTKPLATLAWAAGKHVFLPTINDDQSLNFAYWLKDEVLTRNRYNIAEPPKGVSSCPIPELDIIFLPLVGWDLDGGRLGMGGGFYDRTLTNTAGPLLVGLAHDCQQVDEVPRDSWDVTLHYIATDVALYQCKG